MEFNVVNEKNEFKLGNIMSVFKLPNSDREIALFSISCFDRDDDTLNIAYINKDSEGYSYLEEIKDKEVFKKAMAVVQDMVRTINTKEK